MGQNALIIFARNPEAGTVKTRLAARIGAQAALDVYVRLLTHTREVARGSGCTVHVFLTGPPADDFWQGCRLHRQADGDLGARMLDAFSQVLGQGCQRAVIIGSDCPGLETADIQRAINLLADHDVVIGPAADGGYYLLGMKRLHEALFSNKSWSTETVCAETLAEIRQAGLSCAQLRTLRDVDTLEDLEAAGWS